MFRYSTALWNCTRSSWRRFATEIIKKPATSLRGSFSRIQRPESGGARIPVPFRGLTSFPREDLLPPPPHSSKKLEIPVSAYFVGHKIDLAGVNGDLKFRHYRQGSTRDCVLFAIPLDLKDNVQNDVDAQMQLVVFKYGSVVFFNVPRRSDIHWEYISVCKKYTAEPLPMPNEDVHSLLIRPKMTHWHRQEDNHIILKVLDVDNIKVISSVLGQSVALDQYSKKADLALEEFGIINREIVRTGGFSVDRRTLFKIIARNNLMITEAIVMLGLLDRSDTAWKNDRYYAVWSMMHNEYELATRFAAVDKKLMLIQQSAKHFLEILQDNKSNFLEILIIVLIAAEIVVMLYDIVHR